MAGQCLNEYSPSLKLYFSKTIRSCEWFFLLFKHSFNPSLDLLIQILIGYKANTGLLVRTFILELISDFRSCKSLYISPVENNEKMTILLDSLNFPNQN